MFIQIDCTVWGQTNQKAVLSDLDAESTMMLGQSNENLKKYISVIFTDVDPVVRLHLTWFDKASNDSSNHPVNWREQASHQIWHSTEINNIVQF